MMPPHVVDSPRRSGDELVIEGYSLHHLELGEELSILDAEGRELSYDLELHITRQDRSGGAVDPPPGSIQFKGVLTVNLDEPQHGGAITVRFLGEEWTL